MNLLITGIGTYLGQIVVSRLVRHNPFRRVFGLARKPPPMLGPAYFIGADLRTVDLGDLLVINDVEAVLHLAWTEGHHDTAKDEVEFVRRLFEIAEPAGLHRIVVASRDLVYAPSAVPVDEDAKLLPIDDRRWSGNGLLTAALGVEAAIAAYRATPGAVPVVVPRLGPVVGPTRGRIFDAVLARRPLIGPLGGAPAIEPMMQFLHAADAAEVLLSSVLRPDLDGPYNAAGAEPLRLSTVAGILETTVLHPPSWLARPAVAALSRLGILPFGPADTARLHHGVPMNTERLQRDVCTLRFTSRQALAVWRVGRMNRRGELHAHRHADPLGEA